MGARHSKGECPTQREPLPLVQVLHPQHTTRSRARGLIQPDPTPAPPATLAVDVRIGAGDGSFCCTEGKEPAQTSSGCAVMCSQCKSCSRCKESDWALQSDSVAAGEPPTGIPDRDLVRGREDPGPSCAASYLRFVPAPIPAPRASPTAMPTWWRASRPPPPPGPGTSSLTPGSP